MKLIIKTSFILFFIFVSQIVNAQKLNQKLVGVYIINFIKNIEWPDNATSKEFLVGIIGNGTMEVELTKLANNRKIQGRTIKVKAITASEAKNCHLVYINASESNKAKDINKNFSLLPILIVSEKQGMAKNGADISMFLDFDNELTTKFEVNKNKIEQKKLKISKDLISLSTIVN